MAKQQVSTFDIADTMQTLFDGIQRASDRGYTVQTMTTIRNKVVVVFNTSQLPIKQPEVSSQFADRSPNDGPY